MRNLEIPQARTMKELADVYSVSEEDLREQIENFPSLKAALEKAHFGGKIFFPKQQFYVFNSLGEIEKKTEPRRLPIKNNSSEDESSTTV